MKKTESTILAVATWLAGVIAGTVGGVLWERRSNAKYMDTLTEEINGAADDIQEYRAATSKVISYYRQTNTDLAGLAARISKLLELHDDAHPGAHAHETDWVARMVAGQVRTMQKLGWQFDADPDDLSYEGWFTAISPAFDQEEDYG